MAKKIKTYGSIQFSKGQFENIIALFTVYRDDREVSVCETEKGTIVVSTKSWLRENNRELVEATNYYTKETFVMMYEAMTFGAEYFGIDILSQMARLHAGDDCNIRFEYAGKGKPTFLQEPSPVAAKPKRSKKAKKQNDAK